MSHRSGHSSRGASSNKKKHGSSAHHAQSAHRPTAAAAAAASSAHRAPHRPYFPSNTQEAQQRAGAKTPAMRSRANSSAQTQRTMFGDPFAEVRLRVDSPEPHMAQANLVLSAIDGSIDESLRAAGRPVESKSATDYYGAIMVSLEQYAQHSPDNLGALLYLLGLVMPQLPPGLLKKPMERIAVVLIAVLKAHANVDHIAKNVLKCCAHLLQATAMESHALWSPTSASPSVVTLLQMMLVYSPDQRPPIRRAAQEGVKDTLKGMYEHSVSAAGATGAGPLGIPKGACDTVVSFCIREISHCTPRDCQVVLYLCGLLQGCIQYLSVSASAQILEAILSMVGRGNNILMVQAMRTVDAFFMHGSEIHMPAEGAHVEPNSPEAKSRDKFLTLASKLLTVLLTLKPHQNDQLATAAYLNTLKVGLVRFMGGLESNAGSQANFAQILATSYDKIPELLALIAEGLLSPKVEVVKGSAKAMGEILRKTLTPGMIEQSMREAAHAASLRGQSSVVPPFYRVIELMENLLGYRFKSEWNRILLLVSELFHATTGMQSAQQLLIPMLKKLDALHVESQGEIASEDPSLDYRPSLDEAIGAAIQSFGPEALLTVLPLDLPLDFYSKNQQTSLHELLQASRSWLLPLFRSYICSGSLDFFSHFFIAIANQLHELEKQSNARGKHLEGRAFQALKISVWDIFPSLCSSLPNDIQQSFKKELKTLLTAHLLVDDMGFDHAPICRGLANIVRKLKEIVAAAQAGQGGAPQKKPAKRDGSDAEDDDEEDEAKATFGIDLDDDDSAGSADDSNDEDVLAKAKAVRKAKKAKAAAAAASAAASSSKAASAASASREVGSRRPAPYTAAQAQSLLYDTIAPTSERVLPVLFNRAAMPSEKQREAIFEAIAQFASITESELLNKHFKKVLRMLLEHSMAQTKEKAAAEEGMADAAAAPSNAKSQAAQRSHMLTDIVAALCLQSSASLSAENLDYLYKILKSQLSADLTQMDAGLQKKVYKILAGLCSNHPTFFNGRWREIIADLAAASGNLHPAALKQRLACVRHVLLFLPELMLKDKSAISMLPGFLGEVILACKEITAKTRDYAFSVLLELGHKMRSVEQARKEASGMAGQEIFGALSQPMAEQPLMTEFVYMITAGLAGTSNHMQSASVLCLARVLYEFKDVLGSKIVGQILDLVLPLFESKSRELIKSLLTFIKVCILTFDNESLLAHLPAIVGGLVLWCHEKKNRFKPKIKVLFEILMRKVGVDPVRELVPEQHTALIEHIRKSKEREKRIKTEHWKNSKKGADDDEDGDGTSHKPREDYESIMKDDELAAEDAASSAPAGPKLKQKGGQKSGKDVNPLWIRDEADVDFMDAQNVVSKVTASNPQMDAQLRRGTGFALGHGVTQDAGSGKLVIAGGSKGSAPLTGAAAAAMLDVEALDSEIRAKQKDKRKRQAEEDDDDAEDDHTVKKQQLPGQQFRSAKAGGDMMRKGQLAPHAFVALDPMAMNKRKKFTAQRRLESIVNAAKTGAGSGSSMAKKGRSHKNKSHKKHGN